MKKIIIPLLVTLSFIFHSCSETESPIYDGSQTLVYFDSTSSRLEIVIDESGSIDLTIGASTLSSSDRTVNVSIDEASTTADPAMYSFNSTVTIPANSYTGTLTLNGVDVGLTTAGVTIGLKIDSIEGGIASTRLHQITMVEICPIPEDFMVGDYLIEQQSGVGPFSSIVSVFDVQTVTIPGDGTIREFDFLYSPSTFASDFHMVLTLVCNTFQIDGNIQSGSLSCNGGATQIGQGNATTESPYDLTDDSVITLYVSDFIAGEDGGCNVDPYDIELKLTKQ